MTSTPFRYDDDFAPIMVGDRALFELGIADGAKGAALFANQGLHSAARAFAASHPLAIQYLEQAPALVLGAMLGGPSVRRVNLLYIQHKLVPLCERGAKLKDVMRAFGLAPPLRKLRASAIFPSAGPTTAALCKLDPAVLGRIVPEKPGAQKRWMTACVFWREHLARRRRSPDTHFAWAAEAMSLAGITRNAVTAVADFAGSGEPFNEAWGWPRAEEEADAWHGRITVDQTLRGAVIKKDTVVDLGAHPDEATSDGLTFHALRTPLAIGEEGSAMRHCVATYVGDVIAGRSHIVSVRKGERRIATLELSKAWMVRQLKGRFNADPGGDVRTAAAHYAFDIRKALQP